MVAALLAEQLCEMVGSLAVAARIEHPREQLLGRLSGLKISKLIDLAGREHQSRLQFEQSRDQHDELGRHLKVELTARLKHIDIRDDDLGEIQIEQINFLAQNERQQQVKRTREELKVELNLSSNHCSKVTAAAGRRPNITIPIRTQSAAAAPYARRSPPIAARTPPSVAPAPIASDQVLFWIANAHP